MEVNVGDLLNIGRNKLKKNNIDISEARMLLAFVLGVEQEKLTIINKCDEKYANKYFEYVSKRIQGVPYAYIVGKQEFMKLPFIVTKDVLIPRQDTEILVEHTIELAKKLNKANIDILDMCTGSGCIAISLKKYILNCTVCGVDISQEALDVARKNAQLNNIDVKFIQSNLFENISNIEYDIIVSNPPYIKSQIVTSLQKEVRNEPIIALDGGKEGLDMYIKIIKKAKEFLKENGHLILEIGYDQANEVKQLLQQNMYKQIRVIKDLSNNDRVVISRV